MTKRDFRNANYFITRTGDFNADNKGQDIGLARDLKKILAFPLG